MMTILLMMLLMMMLMHDGGFRDLSYQNVLLSFALKFSLQASFWIYQIKEGQSKTQLPASVYANLPETRWTWPIKCLVRAYVICVRI